MSGGALLVLAGIWVGCQVLGGNALGRLGISGDPSPVGTKKKPGTPVDTPAALPGLPNAGQLIAAAQAAVKQSTPYPGLIPNQPPASIAAPRR